MAAPTAGEEEFTEREPPSPRKLQHLCTHRERRRLLTDGFHACELENIYRSRKWRSGSGPRRKREMVERSLSTRILRYLKPFARNVRGTGKEKW
jgi:hypothetical protein